MTVDLVANITACPTTIPGCHVVRPFLAEDSRGRFAKVFQDAAFARLGLEVSFREDFYSVSRQRVLRGLHFQFPPFDGVKLVYCTEGVVLDAVLDLRSGSPTFGKHFTVELSGDTGDMLYVPRGVAHGFYVLSSQATMLYKMTAPHVPSHDTGIRWNSAGIAWPDASPILSARDESLPRLAECSTPFRFGDP